MIPLAEAQARVGRDIKVLSPELVDLADARGLVLAEPAISTEAIPPFANTAMDGFALRFEDSIGASEDNPKTLPVVATIAAGSVAPRSL